MANEKSEWLREFEGKCDDAVQLFKLTSAFAQWLNSVWCWRIRASPLTVDELVRSNAKREAA